MASPQAEAVAFLERQAESRGVRPSECTIRAVPLTAADDGPGQIRVLLMKDGATVAETTAVCVITDRW